MRKWANKITNIVVTGAWRTVALVPLEKGNNIGELGSVTLAEEYYSDPEVWYVDQGGQTSKSSFSRSPLRYVKGGIRKPWWVTVVLI